MTLSQQNIRLYAGDAISRAVQVCLVGDSGGVG
jgi:hypothetical protein